MLNLFCSTSSVSYQFLILESSLFQVIFMRNHTKIPFFEGLCYNHKGLELFSKTNFESSLASEGLTICKILCYPFGLIFCPSPFKVEQIEHSTYFKKELRSMTETFKNFLVW